MEIGRELLSQALTRAMKSGLHCPYIRADHSSYLGERQFLILEEQESFTLERRQVVNRFLHLKRQFIIQKAMKRPLPFGRSRLFR